MLTRLAGLGDIRAIGSGNIGATNVLRTGNNGLAAATLLLDAGKGAVAVLVARRFGPEMAAVAAICAVLGHIFPVWLGFKGGKGVATTAGVLLAYAWPVGLAALATWLAVAISALFLARGADRGGARRRSMRGSSGLREAGAHGRRAGDRAAGHPAPHRQHPAPVGRHRSNQDQLRGKSAREP